jgi:glycosyltransferase involved in cell wall biosynthesis
MMTNPPLVTIILPLYNGESFIKETIASVLSQSYGNFELLVIDDGSTDRGRELLPDDSRIRLFVRDNHGVAATRNFGIAQARGELLAFIDQDDEWLPEKLALQVRNLLENQETDYNLTMMRYQLTGGISRPWWLKPEQVEKEQVGLLPSGLLARPRAFTRVGLFNEELVNASDMEWFLWAERLGVKREIIDQVLLLHKIHDHNRSHDQQTNKKELFRILRRQIAAGRRENADRE